MATATAERSLAFVLMDKILEIIKESGANDREASAALAGASAMLTEIQLESAPALTITSYRPAS